MYEIQIYGNYLDSSFLNWLLLAIFERAQSFKCYLKLYYMSDLEKMT